jgi:UDP-N-acetylglucosamine acyltransferase
MIHPTALVAPDSLIAAGVEIGPFAIIGSGVEIGAHCRIGPHAALHPGVRMGPRNVLHHGAVIGGLPQSLTFDPAIPSGVVIGEGNTFREYVTVHRSTQAGGATCIGSGNFLMAGVHIGHDSALGDHNVLANNVLIAGHVTIGSRCFLGGGTGIHQFIRIGDYAMAQGNSSISQDVPPCCMVSRLNCLDGLNTIGLRRAGFDSTLRMEIKRAWRTAYHSPDGPVKAAAAALAEHQWPDPARQMLAFIAAAGPKGVITPGRVRTA